MGYLRTIISILLLVSLTACGGGGSTSNSSTNNNPVLPESPTETVLSRSDTGAITVSGKAKADSTITITFPDGSIIEVTADANGNYSATSTHSQPVGDTTIISTDSDNNSSKPTVVSAIQTPIANSISSDSSGVLSISGVAEPNSSVMAQFPDGSTQTVTANSDGDFTVSSASSQPMGPIKVSSSLNNIESAPSFIASTEVEKILFQTTGVMPPLAFEPSLGVNTEPPQGGVDTVGMPMPFVDIFRTARPFMELSASGTEYDENGWPTKLDANTNVARSKLLQGTMGNSLPQGKYTVLYDGSGTLEFSASPTITNIKKETGENKYTFDLTLRNFDPEDEAAAADTNAFNLNIKNITSSDYVKNIRIVMPGGTCSGNPFIRVDSQDDCPVGSTYESFEERLKADRNAIIFNSDYLAFLRNFKVVRMMNLMEASLKQLCGDPDTCPAEIGTWDHKATMDDAVWGGNDGRTAHEDHKGVPIEVMVALGNTLERDIWVNMPHVASDDYVKNYAKYVYDNLNPGLKVYIEYSNEVWNNGFAANEYTTKMGKGLGLDDVPTEFIGSNRDGDYFARLRYHSQRSVEIFKLWEAEFGGSTSRIVRVLGSFIGDKVLTEQMLKHIDPMGIDAVAIAPYFFGCPYEAICVDAPKTLLEATSVDDIFDIIDQDSIVDVKSLDGTVEAVKNQLGVTSQYNVKLVTYEGGQHLVTGVFGSNIDDTDKPRLRALFNDANRDPRMKERYVRFLNAWKDLSGEGASLFTLYTLPQSYYRFGNFGLKEHLNSARSESPKFDGVMSFQESVGQCWWDNCTP